MTTDRPTVALFVTCLVDLFRPRVGFAAIKLLEAAGCAVVVPDAQTCCGQPGYNSGDRADAVAIARQVIDAFAPYAYVVAPSGSCAGMIKRHYPTLFGADDPYRAKAEDLARRTHELTSFLVDIRGATRVAASYRGTIAYHDSCSSLREMGVSRQPRLLLASVDGATLAEAANPEVCCGFGGAFSVKYGDISNEMAGRKTQSLAATGAATVAGGDLGCLLNIAGKLKRDGSTVTVRHVAEILADDAHGPAIGEARDATGEGHE